MTLRNVLTVVLIVLACSTSLIAAPAPSLMTSLVQGGQSVGVILISDTATPDELLAANELQQYLGKISGTTLPIEKATANWQDQTERIKAEKRYPVLVGGFALSDDERLAIEAKGNDPSSFLLKVTGSSITVAGLSPGG